MEDTTRELDEVAITEIELDHGFAAEETGEEEDPACTELACCEEEKASTESSGELDDTESLAPVELSAQERKRRERLAHVIMLLVVIANKLTILLSSL